MNEEEKGAIRALKKHSEDNDYWLSYEIEIVLNLIENQQKEIEKYKKQIDLEYVENNYVEKSELDKKDKIINEM